MIEQESQPHVCYNCDEEFIVSTPYETEAIVEFCPFCGSDVEVDEDQPPYLSFDEDEDDKLTEED